MANSEQSFNWSEDLDKKIQKAQEYAKQQQFDIKTNLERNMQSIKEEVDRLVSACKEKLEKQQEEISRLQAEATDLRQKLEDETNSMESVREEILKKDNEIKQLQARGNNSRRGIVDAESNSDGDIAEIHNAEIPSSSRSSAESISSQSPLQSQIAKLQQEKQELQDKLITMKTEHGKREKELQERLQSLGKFNLQLFESLYKRVLEMLQFQNETISSLGYEESNHYIMMFITFMNEDVLVLPTVLELLMTFANGSQRQNLKTIAKSLLEGMTTSYDIVTKNQYYNPRITTRGIREQWTQYVDMMEKFIAAMGGEENDNQGPRPPNDNQGPRRPMQPMKPLPPLPPLPKNSPGNNSGASPPSSSRNISERGSKRGSQSSFSVNLTNDDASSRSVPTSTVPDTDDTGNSGSENFIQRQAAVNTDRLSNSTSDTSTDDTGFQGIALSQRRAYPGNRAYPVNQSSRYQYSRRKESDAAAGQGNKDDRKGSLWGWWRGNSKTKN